MQFAREGIIPFHKVASTEHRGPETRNGGRQERNSNSARGAVSEERGIRTRWVPLERSRGRRGEMDAGVAAAEKCAHDGRDGKR